MGPPEKRRGGRPLDRADPADRTAQHESPDHDSPAVGVVDVWAQIHTDSSTIRAAARDQSACVHRRSHRFICAACACAGLWCARCLVAHELTHPAGGSCTYCRDDSHRAKPLPLRLDSGVWIIGARACDRCLIAATIGRRLAA